jgi:uncharacterized protein YcaQ
MSGRSEVSSAEARWLALDAQGLARPRPKGRVGTRQLRSAIAAVGELQLDAINVLQRTQFVVPFSRVGSYDVELVHDMCGPGGELFEYWGHAASLLPMEHHPLFRWRMAQHGTFGDSPTYSARREAFEVANAEYIRTVFDEVRERGPLTAAQLTDPRRRNGEWWNRRSLGRVVLEYLFAKGDLAAWRTPDFERVYDLPERVVPDLVRTQPTPAIDEAHRRLLTLAARSLGVATVRDLAGYYVLKPRIAKLRVAELVEAGELTQMTVEGWAEPGYSVPIARPRPPSRRHATLLSPFDSLIRDRSRTRRVFGFDYRIEVYVPEPKRKYGYFVLPLLLGDRLVARFDLRADRRTSTLQVRGSYVEAGCDPDAVARAAADELHEFCGWLKLDRIGVARRGNLAAAVRRAAGTATSR